MLKSNILEFKSRKWLEHGSIRGFNYIAYQGQKFILADIQDKSRISGLRLQIPWNYEWSDAERILGGTLEKDSWNDVSQLEGALSHCILQKM